MTSTVRLQHQRVTRVTLPVSKYCDRFELGETFLGPADISWGPDTLVKPDAFVVPRSELSNPDWSTVKTLRFVAEVLRAETATSSAGSSRSGLQTRASPSSRPSA